MATLNATNTEPVGNASAAKVDIKFEVVVIPVADVDRAKAFYTKLGWRPDADFAFDNGIRVVQLLSSASKAAVASPGLIPITAATFPLLLSTIRTATPGCPGNYHAVARTRAQQLGRLNTDGTFA